MSGEYTRAVSCLVLMCDQAGGVDGPFAPFVVMKHENWGVVTDEIFFDLADATARFEASLAMLESQF